MKCNFRASFSARTFVNPCLGCEPKIRIATLWVRLGFNILCQKCNFKNESLLGPISFVLVGYMGGIIIFGFIGNGSVPLMDHLWDCSGNVFSHFM